MWGPMKDGSTKEKDPIDVVVISTIVTILALSIAFTAYMEWQRTGATGPESEKPKTWPPIDENGNYIIEILDVESERLEDVSWSILDLNRLIAIWDDPNGDSLRTEGDLSDINYSQEDLDQANETPFNMFYSRDPVGTPPAGKNHTLFIVYMDINPDGKFSSGDVIRIRSMENGGPADEDYRFRMVNERTGQIYGELILPAV